MKHPAFAALAILTAIVPQSVPAQNLNEISAPWRRSDTTLVQLCFDGLDNTAPKRLSSRVVAEGSIHDAGIGLIGFTLAGKLIYQGSIAHPLGFSSVLVQFPNSSLQVRIDRPLDLEKSIDIWRDAPISMCTADS